MKDAGDERGVVLLVRECTMLARILMQIQLLEGTRMKQIKEREREREQ